MAGQKETPRQRMIGMMYLVLTALLALQVSSSIIERFQALNENLEATAGLTSKNSKDKLAAMHLQVEKGGNKAKDIKLEQQAIEISKRSKQMLDYIEEIKKELIKETGGYDENGNYKGAKEETQVEVLMIGASKATGKGYALQRKLSEYHTFMEGVAGRKFPALAPDGKNDPVFSKHPEQRMKDYAQLNFGQTPLVAALATLSETENRIANMEASLLNSIAMELGIQVFQVEGLVPVVSPSSKVVAAGTKYEAQIGLAITGTAFKPEMQVGNQALAVDANGVGSYAFTATGGAYNANGEVKKTWTGKVKVRMRDGRDTVYTITEEYIVARPAVQISSGSVGALYTNCGNKLNIQVPALGMQYRPTFNAEGATIEMIDPKGKIIVMPTAATVKLKVSSNGTFLSEEKIPVRAVPPPTFEVKIGGREPNALIGISMNDLRNIQIKALAEKEFAQALPADATYRVVEWKINFAKNKSGTGEMLQSKESVSLYSEAQQRGVGAGHRVIIEPVRVQRKNYKGQWVEVTNFAKKPLVFVITS